MKYRPESIELNNLPWRLGRPGFATKTGVYQTLDVKIASDDYALSRDARGGFLLTHIHFFDTFEERDPLTIQAMLFDANERDALWIENLLA